MNICLFSSYYVSDAIPYPVRVYLTELRRHFGRVWLLTNDDKDIAPADRRWLVEAGIELMPVANEGYDFGMWTKGVSALGAELDHASELCLANDSCLLVAPLDSLLAAARDSGADVYGLTESHEHGVTHLQSYFLLFRGAGVAAARTFLSGLGILHGGYVVAVDQGELGLSRAMRAQGLKLASFFGTDPAFDENPTILRADLLIRLGHPLLKRRLVRDRLQPLMRRILQAEGEVTGVEACRRLLMSALDMPAAAASALTATDALAVARLPWRLRWLGLRTQINALLGRDRRHLRAARAQPRPGVWRNTHAAGQAPEESNQA